MSSAATVIYPTPPPSSEAGPSSADRVNDPLAGALLAIEAAVTKMWPDGARIGDRIPSVSCVVHRLWDPAGRLLYAKHSMGAPMASVLSARRPPVGRTGGGAVGLERRAYQLHRLRRAGVAVCGPVYVRDGVQVTANVQGDSLTDRLLVRPDDASDLMTRTWDAVSAVHQPYRIENQACLEVTDSTDAITERFAATFRGAASGQLETLGHSWFGPVDRPAVTRRLTKLIHDVGRVASGGEDLPTARESGMAFGGLEPDHVVFLRGRGPRPVLLSPRLQLASSATDAATLVSRVVLVVAATNPPGAPQIAEALVELLETHMAGPVGVAPDEWLRRVVVLWLMDTLTTTATYLAMPRGHVQLPERMASVGRWAPRALAMAELIVRELRRSDALTAAHWGLPAAVAALDTP